MGSEQQEERNAPLLDSSNLETSPKGKTLSSQFKTFSNILISIVGAGVLGLPYTFMKTGWLSGLIILLVVSVTAYYGMVILVWSKRCLEKNSQEGLVIESFGDLGFQVYGKLGKDLVDLMVVLCMVGVCVGYLIFIGDTLSNIFQQHNWLSIPLGVSSLKVGFIGATFPLEVVMSSFRTLTHLAPFSIFADVADISAMLSVVVEDVMSIMKSPGANVISFSGWSAVPYGIGVAIYAFEGVSMVVPLELEMKKKNKFGWVLGLAFMFIVCIYGGFGAFGYIAFGDNTNEIVTLNLKGSWITDFVQLALCLNLFFTFPLMMNPVFEVLEGRINRGQYSLAIRSLVVLVTTMVAIMVPSFTDFLSLIGSSIGCILGFIMPPLFHIHSCWNESSRVWIVADFLVLAFGIVFGFLGTVSSIVELCSY